MATLNKTGLPISLWAEIATSKLYLRNRSPDLRLKIPYNEWNDTRLSLRHIRKLGSKCQVRVSAVECTKMAENEIKLTNTTWNGILVGYAKGLRGYRIWNPITDEVHEIRRMKIEENLIYRDLVTEPITSIENLKDIQIQQQSGHSEQLIQEYLDQRMTNMTSDSGICLTIPALSNSSGHDDGLLVIPISSLKIAKLLLTSPAMTLQSIAETRSMIQARLDAVSSHLDYKSIANAEEFAEKQQILLKTESEELFDPMYQDVRWRCRMTSSLNLCTENEDFNSALVHTTVVPAPLADEADNKPLLISSKLPTFVADEEQFASDQQQFSDFCPSKTSITRKLTGQYANWT
uniref:Retroviral polymerase SH3-like domain-containing protein n=1 Tax=Strigamia maritima TaxID=126957 RepID=T1IMH7_STRMM